MSRILHSYYNEWDRAIIVDLERLWWCPAKGEKKGTQPTWWNLYFLIKQTMARNYVCTGMCVCIITWDWGKEI